MTTETREEMLMELTSELMSDDSSLSLYRARGIAETIVRDIDFRIERGLDIPKVTQKYSRV
jgi:hypothetical protein